MEPVALSTLSRLQSATVSVKSLYRLDVVAMVDMPSLLRLNKQSEVQAASLASDGYTAISVGSVTS